MATSNSNQQPPSSTILNKKHIISHYDPAVLEILNALKLAEASGAAAEVVDSLNKAIELVDLREKFTEMVTTKDSKECEKIMKDTYTTDWAGIHAEGKTSWKLAPQMVSGHLEGQFLKSLVSMQKAKRILDIGMFTGYSALSMAEVLPADGELVTVDKEKFLETYTGERLNASPHGKKIKIHIGSATEFMKEEVAQGRKFDLIFLDADKKEYKDYLKVAFDENLLVAGGTVAVDNAFRHGWGYMPNMEDNETSRLGAAIAADDSLHSVLVPMRDGVILLRRMSDMYGGVPQ